MSSTCLCGFPLGAAVSPTVMKNMQSRVNIQFPRLSDADEDLELLPECCPLLLRGGWVKFREYNFTVHHVLYMWTLKYNLIYSEHKM